MVNDTRVVKQSEERRRKIKESYKNLLGEKTFSENEENRRRKRIVGRKQWSNLEKTKMEE